MLLGIGTDIVQVARLQGLWARQGDRALVRLLAPGEIDAARAHAEIGRFLAKRFAAKEAFAKAMGTGIRGVVGFASIEVIHDALGKPAFEFHGPLREKMAELGARAHLSLSDEQEYVVAFVVIEQLLTS